MHTKLLTFHTDDCLASVELHTTFAFRKDLLDFRRNKLVELVREWVTEHGVNDESFSAEKSLLPDTLGSVDDLVRNDEMAGGNLLP